MLINAMEVTGIEGTYRMTCQKVMSVLRNNKDSLMAVLEAFVYDPLLNWRLVDDNTRHRNNHSAARAATGQQGQGHEMGIAGDVVDADAGAVGGIGVHPHHHVHSHAASTSVTSASVSGTTAANPINTTNEGEVKNKKAVAVVNRVRDKLTGRDFDPNVTLDVNPQVDLLIKQATSHENLCQCYIGWCPFW
jgi:FKBP12-rapamycin complex-associated protein